MLYSQVKKPIFVQYWHDAGLIQAKIKLASISELGFKVKGRTVWGILDYNSKQDAVDYLKRE